MDSIYETLIELRRQVAAYAMANNDQLIAKDMMAHLNKVMALIDQRKSIELWLNTK
jgi:hypothetical protein